MKLRQYQQDLVNDIKVEVKKQNNSVVAVLGCGGGKSVIQSYLAKCYTDIKLRVMFLVHRKELCQQISETFNNMGVNFDYCEVLMVQTASRRIEKLKEPALILTDEAHHSTSETYVKIYDKFPNALRIGFTATPVRLNEGGLGAVYSGMVKGVSTKWLIANNYLAPYKYFSLKLAECSGLNIRAGDYKKEQLALLMEKRKIYGDTVENWKRIAEGKQTIIYCASLEASKSTVKAFNDSNVLSYHLDGSTPKKEREDVMARFRSGEIKVLSNMDLFGEGLDVPDCEVVIMLRPTKSLSLFIQQSMRSMRYKEGKEAIIIDHVGNVYEHGFPDEDREWSLKAKKAKRVCEVPIKECKKCYMVFDKVVRKCPYCGYEIVNEQRYEMEKIEMELKQLKRKDILKDEHHDFYKNLQTFSQLREFQKAKGYKFAWVLRKCQELNIDIPKKYNYMLHKFIS